jgi:predicted secreted protein
MSKQTAVEWLIEQIYFKQIEVKRELFEQAIETEKQQIIDAFNEGYRIGDSDAETFDDDIANFNDASFYYQDTFNK